ncbi:MAG: flagellar hook-basal body complex protein FliE [Proteobacteria bacterium]|nr:flagellar hook-basal body complex protein FliE [Pseudomonadota bacterium]MBU1596010.1 flagellar hook-basal body complex protein FliE [Pseudomonadota bacterium]
MIVKSVAMQAYQNALKIQSDAQGKIASNFKKPAAAQGGFMDALKGNLEKVNDLQNEKSSLATSFAAGKDHNVHELMITLQKAGLAMSMTSAVRSKIMQSYQELTKLQF